MYYQWTINTDIFIEVIAILGENITEDIFYGFTYAYTNRDAAVDLNGQKYDSVIAKYLNRGCCLYDFLVDCQIFQKIN